MNNKTNNDTAIIKAIRDADNRTAPGGLLICEDLMEGCRKALAEPDPLPLYKELWFTNEVCVFFASTNLGKSVLAMQILMGLSEKGYRVMLADFEMSWKQVQIRLTENGVLHEVEGCFKRVHVNPQAYNFDTFEEDVFEAFKEIVIKERIQVLAVDNLSKICNDSEKPYAAGRFMQKLWTLRDELKISILVIAHTPKKFDFSPLTINDLAGSARISQFCDSAFALGKSTQGVDMRYLIQLKSRSGAFIYPASNVLSLRLTKEGGWLHFEEEGTCRETDHINRMDEDYQDNLRQQCQELSDGGKSYREIAKELGINITKVYRLLKK